MSSPVLPPCIRHELHEAHGTPGRHGVGIKGGFGYCLLFYPTPVQVVLLGVVLEQGVIPVVLRYDDRHRWRASTRAPASTLPTPRGYNPTSVTRHIPHPCIM